MAFPCLTVHADNPIDSQVYRERQFLAGTERRREEKKPDKLPQGKSSKSLDLFDNAIRRNVVGSKDDGRVGQSSTSDYNPPTARLESVFDIQIPP